LDRLGQAAGFAQDEFDLVDDVGGFGRIGLVAFVHGAVADLDQWGQGVDIEEGQVQAQGRVQILVGAAGALDAHQLAQRELGQGLAAADLFLGLDELFLAGGRGLA
jgi:hypothetical protein